MKDQWIKKKQQKNLRAPKQKRPANGKVAACAEGVVISEDCEFLSIINTFERRGTALPKEKPLAFTSDFYNDEQKELQWNAFVRKAYPDVRADDLQDVATAASAFIMPVIENILLGNAFEKTWSPKIG